VVDRRIKFRHIECFATIHREGSLKRACAVLSLTQPALSKTLKELETLLGATLMQRGRGGVRLTPEGQAFLEGAETSLAALRRGVDGVEALRRGDSQTLRVGAMPSVAAALMPGAVARFRKAMPGVVVELRDGPHGHLVSELRAGRVDLLVGRLGSPASMQALSFTQLYVERIVCAARPGHPLAARRSVPPAALGDWPVVYPPDDAAIRPLIARTLIAQGVPLPADRIETVSGAFGRNHLLHSDALWIISEGVVGQDLAEGRLVRLDMDLDTTAGPVGLMTRPDETPSAAQRLFTAALTEAADRA